MSPIVMWLWIALATGVVIGVVSFLPEYLGLRRRHWEACDLYDGLHAIGSERLTTLLGRLNDTTTELNETTTERDRVAAELRTATGERERWKKTAAELEAERTRLNGEIGSLTGSLDATRKRIAELDQDRDGLVERLHHIEAELSEVREEREQVAAERDRIRAERDEAIAGGAVLAGKNAELAARIADLDAQIVNLTSERDRLSAEVARLTKEVAGKNEAIEQRGARIGTLEQERDRLSADVARLEKEVAEKHDAIEQANARIGAHVGQIAELEESRSRLSTDVAAHKDAIAEHASELEQRAARIAAHASLIAELKDERSRQSTEVTTHKRTIEELEAEKLAFDTERNEWTAEAERLRENLDKLNDYIDHSRESDPPPEMVPPSWGDSPIIGLDFGTHSTKVVVRRRSTVDVRTRKPWALILDEPAVGYARMATPSLVRLVGDRLLFGTEALRQQQGRLFRSLKTSLLPCSDENGRPSDPMAPVLTAAYLAWILRRIADTIGGDPGKYTIAIGAPMNHEENATLKERYLHVVHAAFLGAFGDGDEHPIDFKKPVSLAEIEPRIRMWLERDLPAEGFRRFHVRPETLAPLVSLHRDPKHKKPGVYMIVDMGAGSTEISINQINDTGNPEPCVHCCDDQTARLGGDHFAANDEKNAFDGPACETEERILVERFWTHYREVCLAGFQKVANEKPTTKAAWSHMSIVQVGGALRRCALEAKIGHLPPLREWLHDATHEVHWHAPSALDCWPLKATMADIAESGPIFAVADGLSIHPWWPEYRRPEEVETVSPRDRRDDGPRYLEGPA
jgi:septal ring factor EnvC (AmiA/AmiB activator)